MKYRLNKYYRILYGSELIKNTSILVAGTILAQLIPIVLQPFLRRYFSPETFGAYSVYLSIMGIVVSIATLKYELAIILPKEDKDSVNILGLSLLINVIFNIILLSIVVFWKDGILQFLNLGSKYSFYLYLLPLGTLLYSSYQCMNYWLIRKKEFFRSSLNKIVRRGTEGTAQVGFAFLKTSNGLIIGDIIGHFFNIIFGFFQIYKSGVRLKSISFNGMKYIGNKYIEFPKYNVVPGFMSACSFLIPAILINKFYSSENAGYFDLSKLLLSIPLALIASSVSNVLLQRISEKFKKLETIRKELLLMLSGVLSIAIVEVFSIALWGEQIFTILFGGQWLTSGLISRIMVWSFALNFIVSSFSSVFIALNKVKLLSIWQIIYFGSIIALYFFKNLEFIGFIKVYVAIEILACSLSIVFMILIIKQYEKYVKMKVSNR